MRKLNPQRIIKACKMSFDGATGQEIAKTLCVGENTISRWRKLELWKQTEQQLVDAEIQQVLKD